VALVAEENVIVLSSGSSQYIYPEHLEVMFDRLSKIGKNKNLQVIFSEPGNDTLSDPLSIIGSEPRGNFSYTHNYSYYAQKNGFDELEWRKICPYTPQEDFPNKLGTIQLYGRFAPKNRH